ncbi:23S rRNA (guanosine2251-2'-O)-methyltransferase RlmB [Thermosynechococcus sp. NK55a]|uniref:23S rRNA (guanosine(2251)-2'-O)-methyltransferase RlmB n=1 Tax=unclassified Thermosynechococcus TaxID=2622553 RepID=UPI0003D91A0A|nr:MULTISPECIES: 23S rRNA (guanosine(2251)-2'-O)-methyltransferase RlmB [unclassified Thermosynechococcus]AHB87752.1 23S rRNA (guanosine2251-2'-O)-methyltransferase RlmB [Thermosynechococcus sp. NK55a]HIK22195.1 23S rRNA (guanosine(2251)-2'-O)-methyltransferase RlmB [Thermosynechococcus sp. M3746_W2019_013]
MTEKPRPRKKNRPTATRPPRPQRRTPAKPIQKAPPTAPVEDAPELLYGRHAVLSALESGRPCNRIWVIPSLRYDPRFHQRLNEAKQQGAIIDTVTPERLDQLCQRGRHQGIAIQVAAYNYWSLEDLLAKAATVNQPVLLAADGITDPQNLGAMIRTAEALGMQGVIIPQRRAVGITATVAKAAAGALEYLPVARVINLNQALETLKAAGYWIYGLSERGAVPLPKITFDRPTVFVVGSEGDGISLQTQKHCDEIVAIPLAGRTSSLNASVAVGIALYEISCQRSPAWDLTQGPQG